MEPLDEEAEALHAEVMSKGAHPIDSLPANGGTLGDMILEKFQREADALASKLAQPDSRVQALETQVAELKALVASLAQPKTGVAIGAK